MTEEEYQRLIRRLESLEQQVAQMRDALALVGQPEPDAATRWTGTKPERYLAEGW